MVGIVRVGLCERIVEEFSWTSNLGHFSGGFGVVVGVRVFMS